MLNPLLLAFLPLVRPQDNARARSAQTRPAPTPPAVPPPCIEPLEPRSFLSGPHPAATSAARLIDAAPDKPIRAPSAATPAPPNAAAKKAATPANARKAKAIAYRGPITITRGGVYSGNWRSLNANVPAVRIRTSDPVIIQNALIISRGTLIDAFAYAANLTVKNTRGYALNPDVAGRFPGRFMDIDGFTRIVAQNNYIEGTSGIYLYNYRGNHTPAHSVRIFHNQAKNVDGRFSDGNGAFLTGPDDNHFVQFFQINGVHNLPAVEIAWNQVINDPGRSRVEESINIHDSSGTSNSPILIHDNYIQGAYAADPAHDAAYTGGGIMLSDNGASHTRAYNNQIVSTSHEGIAISSGHDNQFYNNRIISSGYLPDGRPNPSQNVGAIIWNYNNEPDFADNSARNNLIGWMLNGKHNNAFVPDAALWTNNRAYPGKVTRKSEACEWTLWQKKLAAAETKGLN